MGTRGSSHLRPASAIRCCATCQGTSDSMEKGGKVVILYALRSLFSTFHLPGFTRPVTRHQHAVFVRRFQGLLLRCSPTAIPAPFLRLRRTRPLGSRHTSEWAWPGLSSVSSASCRSSAGGPIKAGLKLEIPIVHPRPSSPVRRLGQGHDGPVSKTSTCQELSFAQ